MKKIVLLLFFVVLSSYVWADDWYDQFRVDKTKEIIATVGVPFSITPYLDLGIPEYYMQQSGGLSDYTVSDTYAFSIVSEVVVTGTKYNGDTYPTALKYTLTPQKTGFFVFKQTVQWRDKGVAGFPQMTYNITVVDLTAINLGTTSLSLYVGDSYAFDPTLTHPNATTTLSWQSSNPSVVSVSNGIIQANNIGTATITCTAHNGVSAQCVVTVNPVLAEEVRLTPASAELFIGESMQVWSWVLPEGSATSCCLKD